MNGIIIIGEPRTGKTTLAELLYNKFRCKIIHSDFERKAMDTVFEDLDVKNNPKFIEYLKIIFTKSQEYTRNYIIVLEVTYIKPKDIYDHFDKTKNFVVCLGVTI